MRETRADTTQALLLALGLHVLLFLLAFLGLWWTRTAAPVSAAGPVIEAELIDASALSASMRRTLRDRPEPVPPVAEPEPEPEPVEQETAPPQPLPEPAPQESPVPPQQQAQERVPVPDTTEQEAVSREAIAGEAREREQEAKRRQEQIDLTERERQEAAERRQRLSEMEEMRQKQLADIRRRQALAARDTKVEAAKLKRLQDYQREQAAASTDAAGATPPPGNNGIDEDLRARWIAAMLRAIEQQWVRPDTAQAGVKCPIRILMLPGGVVRSAEVQPSCPFDELARRSVEAAVLKASPLPYAGFETVTARDFIVNFIAPP